MLYIYIHTLTVLNLSKPGENKTRSLRRKKRLFMLDIPKTRVWNPGFPWNIMKSMPNSTATMLFRTKYWVTDQKNKKGLVLQQEIFSVPNSFQPGPPICRRGFEWLWLLHDIFGDRAIFEPGHTWLKKSAMFEWLIVVAAFWSGFPENIGVRSKSHILPRTFLPIETIKLQSSFSPNMLQFQLSIACDRIQTRVMENNAGLLKCVPAIAFESQLRLTQL